MQLRSILLKDIDPEDYSYRISFNKTNDNSLYHSIQKIGLLQPLICQQKNTTTFRLVCGFKRFQVLKQLDIDSVDTYVVPAQEKSIDVFTIALQDNLTIHMFSPIDMSMIINKLSNEFGVNRKQIIQKYFPLIGLKQNPKVYQRYKPLADLPEKWQQGILDDDVSIETASHIIHWGNKDRESLWRLIKELKPGKNRQREIIRLLEDVARIEHKHITEILNQEDAASILNEKKLTPSQKMGRFKDFLWKQRYPRYMKTEQRFNDLLLQAKCPPEVKLEHPPFFEGETFNVSFAFKNADDFEQKVQFLQKLNENSMIKKITHLP